MKKRSLFISMAAALATAAALAGCGGTTLVDGRTLPPSGLTHRVLIAIQNPSTSVSGLLQIVDGYYDIRSSYNAKVPSFSISGFSGALPYSLQSMPEEQFGVVYGSSDGSLTTIDYSTESTKGVISGLSGKSSSIFITRDKDYVFAASEAAHVFTIVDQSGEGSGSYVFDLPGVYRVSVNPGGSAALVFVRNQNTFYYPRKLSAAEKLEYSGGVATWPLGAVDCQPLNNPGWCLFQALDPSSTKASPVPLTLDRPAKALFSKDGSTAYILNCGPECSGTAASITKFPVAPILFPMGTASGLLPTQAALTSATLALPGGATNALLDGTTMYVVGQKQMPDALWGGYLTIVNTSTFTAGSPVSISDGTPGDVTRMIEADNNTLWIGTKGCINGERANNSLPYGCLTMYNTSTGAVTLLPYKGDATGIAALTGLKKVYTAEGGQVYIYSTADGSSIDNQYVTVTGTAYDVAYIDALTDSDNTVY